MRGFVDVGEYRFDEQGGLVRLEIVDEYGFVASTVSMDLSFKRVIANAPEILMHDADDRVLVGASIELGNGVARFAGYLDDVGGSLNRFEAPQVQVSVSGRSLLSLLLDEGDDNKIRDSYVDTDWSKVVSDIVQAKGFGPDWIESSGVMAGERLADGRYLLTIDNETPGAVIEKAVSATGFVANTTASMQFIFKHSVVPPGYQEYSFTFTSNSREGEIDSAPFSNGAIDSIVTKKTPLLITPGSEVHILTPSYPYLGGIYYVTRSRYVVSYQGDPPFAEYNLARELPALKEGQAQEQEQEVSDGQLY